MTTKAALRDLKNAVADLIGADFNTFEQPLKRIAQALNSDGLRNIADELKAGADFDAFLEAATPTRGMVGSARLNWPEDRQQLFGITIHILEKAAANPSWLRNLAHEYYYGGGKIIADIRKFTSAVVVPFQRDFTDYVLEMSPAMPERAAPSDSHRVFIVHGHDEAPRETVARFIATLGLEPVILHEQANRGQTIPEKLAANSNVGFAVVLLTPDDLGRAKTESEDKPRARQNVILELGYFVGVLGRERVCALRKGDLEIPSDFTGVVYTEFDAAGAWKQSLARELQAAGYSIDWNKVMR